MLFIFITWTQTEVSGNEAGKMSVILVSDWFAYSINQWLISTVSFHSGSLTWLWIICLQAFVWMEKNHPDVSSVSLRINVALPECAVAWFAVLICSRCAVTTIPAFPAILTKPGLQVVWGLVWIPQPTLECSCCHSVEGLLIQIGL